MRVAVSVDSKHLMCYTDINCTQCSLTSLRFFKVSIRFVFPCCVPQAERCTATIARDVVTIPGPLFIVGEHATFLPSGWVTVITQSHHNPQWAPPGNSVLSISIPALAILEVSVKTSSTPIITPIPIPNAATQLGAELALVDPIGLCTINTAPLGMYSST